MNLMPKRNLNKQELYLIAFKKAYQMDEVTRSQRW